MLSIPDENKIEELLGKIQPIPSVKFHERVKQTSWRAKQNQSGSSKSKLFLKLAIAMVLLLTIVSLAITPQGQAWAQEAAHFFQRINSPTVQLSDEQVRSMSEAMDRMDKTYDIPLIPVIIPPVAPEMASITGCETPQKSQSYHCQIALAESKLGFDLKELPQKPEGWEFKSLYVNAASQSAVINYILDFKYLNNSSTSFATYSSLQLVQGMGDIMDNEMYGKNLWEVVPADKVEPVSIGIFKGEYVKGRFGLRIGNDSLTWEEGDVQRLFWSEGDQWYLIELSPNLNLLETMGRDELIDLAESLTASSQKTTEPLNPDHLLSISDAEKVSGLNLKSPMLIPMDMDFSYARFLPSKEQVQLFYGVNEDLIIYEWIGDPIDYKKPLGSYEYSCEIVNMNSQEALYCFFESKKMRSFLWWHWDGMNYQMYFNDSLISGARINREQMLLIAESMQDVDDFAQKGNRTYAQTAIYAQAMGITLKIFSEDPSEWVYSTFWSDAYSKCIDLIYKSTVGNSTLFVNQCGTDHNHSSNISIFPSRSIEKVRVGNDKGQFITGAFNTTEYGSQIWDSTMPVKQLYWQQDGLWMNITLYGDQALITDKEDLISLAESLQ